MKKKSILVKAFILPLLVFIIIFFFLSGPILYQKITGIKNIVPFSALKKGINPQGFNLKNKTSLASEGLFYDDAAHQYFPDILALAHTLQNHNIPMRRPGVFCGSTSFTRSSDNPFFYFPIYPLLYFANLSNPNNTFFLIFLLPLALHLTLGFFGFYRLCSSNMCLSKTASIWISVLYIMSPSIGLSVTSMNQTFMLCLLPWALSYTLDFLKITKNNHNKITNNKDKKKSLLSAGLVSGLIILTGDVNYIWRAAVMLILLTVAFFISHLLGSKIKKADKIQALKDAFKGLVIILIIACLISAPVLYSLYNAWTDYTLQPPDLLADKIPLTCSSPSMLKSLAGPWMTGTAGIIRPGYFSRNIINNDGNIVGGIIFLIVLVSGLLLMTGVTEIFSKKIKGKIDEISSSREKILFSALLLLGTLFFYLMTGASGIPGKMQGLFPFNLPHPVYFSFILNFTLLLLAALSMNTLIKLAETKNNNHTNSYGLKKGLIYLLIFSGIVETLFYGWFFFHKTPVQPNLYSKNRSAILFHQRYHSPDTHPLYSSLNKIYKKLSNRSTIKNTIINNNVSFRTLCVPSSISKAAEAHGFLACTGYDSRDFSPCFKKLIHPLFQGWPYSLIPLNIPDVLLQNLGIKNVIFRKGLFKNNLPIKAKKRNFALQATAQKIESDDFIKGDDLDFIELSKPVDFLFFPKKISSGDLAICLAANLEVRMDEQAFCSIKLPDSIKNNDTVSKVKNISGRKFGNQLKISLDLKGDNDQILVMNEIIPGGDDFMPWQALASSKGTKNSFSLRNVFRINRLFLGIIITKNDKTLILNYRDKGLEMCFFISLISLLFLSKGLVFKNQKSSLP